MASSAHRFRWSARSWTADSDVPAEVAPRCSSVEPPISRSVERWTLLLSYCWLVTSTTHTVIKTPLLIVQ